MTTDDGMEMSLLPKLPPNDAGAAGSGTSHAGMASNDGFDARTEASETVTYPAARNIQPEHPDSQSFFKLLSLWIGTTILTALVIVIVTVYRAKDVLTPAQKNTYNFLSTVLILFLGLSFFEAFKELARAMQERIKGLFKSQEEEKELIDDFDSLLKVVRLTYVTTHWRLRLFCIIWLLINIVAQMLSALISLESTVDDGNNYNVTYFREGKVQVSNLTCYSHKGCCPSPVTIHALAHAYGEMTLASECGNYSEVADIINSKKDYEYYCRRDPSRQEFSHRFYEYNPNDTQKAYPRFTDRIIRAASGDCFEYDQVGTPAAVTLGDVSASNFTYTNNSIKGSISIPTSSLGREGTTYIYRGKNVPAEATTEACGLRCIWMWVYKNPGATDGPKFYQCPINVSVVSNVTQPAHNVSAAVARVAAASIALQGQFQGSIEDPIWTQYQFYASGSPWEVHHKEAEQVGANMAEFAIGSLSTMVDKNPLIHIDGTVPFLGSRLSVRWTAFDAILACIVATHFAVFALTYWVAQRRG